MIGWIGKISVSRNSYVSKCRHDWGGINSEFQIRGASVDSIIEQIRGAISLVIKHAPLGGCKLYTQESHIMIGQGQWIIILLQCSELRICVPSFRYKVSRQLVSQLLNVIPFPVHFESIAFPCHTRSTPSAYYCIYHADIPLSRARRLRELLLEAPCPYQ